MRAEDRGGIRAAQGVLLHGRVETHEPTSVPSEASRPARTHRLTNAGVPVGSAPHRSRLRRGVVALLVLAALVYLAGIVGGEAIRRQLERRVNASLDGYTATIGRAFLRLGGFTLDLRDVTVVQNAQPDPPVVYLPRWTTSLDWRALLQGGVVAQVVFERPQIYAMPAQAAREARDPTPVTERGWQDAVTAVYPLEVNRLVVEDGDLWYFDTGPLGPLHLRDVELRADDIRNVRSARDRYPSPIRLSATIFDRGTLRVRGDADLLATPHAAVRARYELRDVDLAHLDPVARPYGVSTKGGTLGSVGRLAWAPWRKSVAVREVSVDRADLAYVHRADTAAEAARADAVARSVTKVERAPAVRVDVAHATLRDSRLAYEDRTATPPYRLFVDDTDVTVRGFSNAREARRGTATVRGRFMGTGPAAIDARFDGSGRGPDFGFDVAINDVELRTVNDLLRAKGGFDVAGGRLSLFMQADVRQGRIEGYVKPLFADIDVYDRAQDADKGPARQLYEGVVGGVANLLENWRRDEVATRTDISGPVERPETSTLEIVLRLLENAFVKAILPGLEESRRRR